MNGPPHPTQPVGSNIMWNVPPASQTTRHEEWLLVECIHCIICCSSCLLPALPQMGSENSMEHLRK